MIQCTVYESPSKTIQTEYGQVRFKEWLAKEQARIDEPSQVRRDRQGQVALFVSDKGLNLIKSSEELNVFKHIIT